MEDLNKVLNHYNKKVEFFYECLLLFELVDPDDNDTDVNVKEHLVKTLDSCRKVYHMTLEIEYLYGAVYEAYKKYKYGLSIIYVIDCLIFEVGDCYFWEEEDEEN